MNEAKAQPAIATAMNAPKVQNTEITLSFICGPDGLFLIHDAWLMLFMPAMMVLAWGAMVLADLMHSTVRQQLQSSTFAKSNGASSLLSGLTGVSVRAILVSAPLLAVFLLVFATGQAETSTATLHAIGTCTNGVLQLHTSWFFFALGSIVLAVWLASALQLPRGQSMYRAAYRPTDGSAHGNRLASSSQAREAP
ncbi:hypothetical protein [Acidovorax sp. SUPP2825]|uniref:hypothetical protein n=1 Tax=Acidovorax sp. SUPP2825 TaxID=2920879 RepID=UPI0023DE3320|nr:hypothetical protein [Acidovorax sp. SUPP2825]GKS97422.1 hypothetical protein AVAK2825_22825 [Acidovorax sp. SUPP2825]